MSFTETTVPAPAVPAGLVAASAAAHAELAAMVAALGPVLARIEALHAELDQLVVDDRRRWTGVLTADALEARADQFCDLAGLEALWALAERVGLHLPGC